MREYQYDGVVRQVKVHNPNCDGNKCHSDTGEVRVYPLGGGGNLILCRQCWTYENIYRHSKGDRDAWPPVDWSTARVYPDEAESENEQRKRDAKEGFDNG